VIFTIFFIFIILKLIKIRMNYLFIALFVSCFFMADIPFYEKVYKMANPFGFREVKIIY